MSKLDDIDYTVTVRSIREFSELGDNVATNMRIQLSDKAKQQIKDLMLDLINASDAYVATGSDNGVWRSDKDLREKVNEL